MLGPEIRGIDSSRYSDKDRDKIFDDFEEDLAELPSNEVVVAIVETYGLVSAQHLSEWRDRVGHFETDQVWKSVKGFSAKLTRGQVLALSEDSFVRQISGDDQGIELHMSTARVWYGIDKAVTDFAVTGDRDGNNDNYSTDDVVVCVPDSGIDTSHIDLNNGQVLYQYDYVNDDTIANDDYSKNGMVGHGTPVAGIIAGQGDGAWTQRGVAYGAAFIILKVANNTGSILVSDAVAAIDFCIFYRTTFNIKVINFSAGGLGPSDGNDPVGNAMGDAYSAGILPIVAAGNSGPYKWTIGTPGVVTNVVAVCLIADPGEGGFLLSRGSSRGPRAGDDMVKPDVCAPGAWLRAPRPGTTNGYDEYTGTSFATAFVSGVAVLMFDQDYTMTVSEARDLLTWKTAIDWNATGKDIDTGFGRLNGYEAIRRAGGDTGSGPTVPAHYRFTESINSDPWLDQWDFSVTSTSHPVAVSFLMSQNASQGVREVTLYLYDPPGNILASSHTTTRQESVSYQFPPQTGTYSVIVQRNYGLINYGIDFSCGCSSPQLVIDF